MCYFETFGLKAIGVDGLLGLLTADEISAWKLYVGIRY